MLCVILLRLLVFVLFMGRDGVDVADKCKFVAGKSWKCPRKEARMIIAENVCGRVALCFGCFICLCR